ncbi:MAG: hypothetical protein AB3N16_05155 [Flavobacteriaceae bacterium]
MLKQLAHITISLLLTISILGPSLVVLLNEGHEIIAMEMNEDEGKEKETEKESNKKELFFEGKSEFISYGEEEYSYNYNTSFLFPLDHSLEIPIPPPESLAL